MSFTTANPIFLPLQNSNLDKMESAFLGQNGLPQFHVALGLGNASRVSGQCVDRHLTHSGVCWGSFDGEHTRYVDNKDHPTSCALEENRIVASAVGYAPGGTNQMGTYSSGGSMTAPQCTARSYGTYSNCPNCSLSGATVYDCQCSLSNSKAIWSTNPSNC